MTKEEKALLEMTADLCDRYMLLPKQHNNDAREFMDSLHRIQHLIMIRPTRRSGCTRRVDLEWVD